ncbi:hypothetical protein [Chryseobacterium sp. SC28]|uniref:hypothetical protein n=1 Tax=Chryseobacterium sp. SC28 TaxID=2268028 RepID=UPI000F653636|nr:hypothetical protein [Chryseobacterium sp. SC28]
MTKICPIVSPIITSTTVPSKVCRELLRAFCADLSRLINTNGTVAFPQKRPPFNAVVQPRHLPGLPPSVKSIAPKGDFFVPLFAETARAFGSARRTTAT